MQSHVGDPLTVCSALLRRSIQGILPPRTGSAFSPGVQRHREGMLPGHFNGIAIDLEELFSQKSESFIPQ